MTGASNLSVTEWQFQMKQSVLEPVTGNSEYQNQFTSELVGLVLMLVSERF